ncbi:hypothetical protein Hanom_Chr09g00814971 [Helianthus anomalus]
MCLIVKVRDLASWTVIDVGTDNGLLQELAKQGCVFFSFLIHLVFLLFWILMKKYDVVV